MTITTVTGNVLLESGSFPPVVAATTGAAIILAGVQTIDGVSVGNNAESVLVKDQADQTANGIYAAQTGAWVRRNDAAGNQRFFDGMAVTVSDGALNGGQTFLCTSTDNPVIVGTSAITFQSQTAVIAAQYTATSSTSVTIDTTIAAGGVGVLTADMAVEYVIDGGGAPITSGVAGFLEIPFDCVILRWSLFGNAVGSIVVDIWDAPAASFPPNSGNSIVGSTKPTLSTQQAAQGTVLTGWTTALHSGDVLAYNVVSASVVQRVTVSLYCARVP